MKTHIGYLQKDFFCNDDFFVLDEAKGVKYCFSHIFSVHLSITCHRFRRLLRYELLRIYYHCMFARAPGDRLESNTLF